jgi:tetratricopeptide (TPR) repeat protein
MPTEYCFPFRPETIDVLRAALKSDPSDARANYYLGNLLFDPQPEGAITCWEKSRSLDPDFATVHRNLGWAYYRVRNEVAEAINCYEKALACQRLDPTLYLEADLLYEIGNVSPQRRLAVLEKNHDVVCKRNESFVREITVLVLAGKYEKAIDYLTNNFFHVREGGGEIHDVYVDAHLLQGLKCMKENRPAKALDHFLKASEYPENLSVGRPGNDRRAPHVAHCIGRAYEAMGDEEKAREFYQASADQQGTYRWSETRFYQGLSLSKLGREAEASETFDGLIEAGRRNLIREESSDFFAKFGEQETKQARKASAHYVLGLGLLGRGRTGEASKEFETAVKLNVGHVWARYQLSAH